MCPDTNRTAAAHHQSEKREVEEVAVDVIIMVFVVAATVVVAVAAAPLSSCDYLPLGLIGSLSVIWKGRSAATVRHNTSHQVDDPPTTLHTKYISYTSGQVR